MYRLDSISAVFARVYN